MNLNLLWKRISRHLVNQRGEKLPKGNIDNRPQLPNPRQCLYSPTCIYERAEHTILSSVHSLLDIRINSSLIGFHMHLILMDPLIFHYYGNPYERKAHRYTLRLYAPLHPMRTVHRRRRIQRHSQSTWQLYR